jgi:AraC-like DNA-binding protein
LIKKKKRGDFYMVFACSMVGYVLLYHWAAESDLIRYVPALALSDNSAILFTAPILYLVSFAKLHETPYPIQRERLLFILPILFAIGFAIYNGVTVPTHIQLYGTVPSHFEKPGLRILTFVTHLTITAVLVYNLLAHIRSLGSGSATKQRMLKGRILLLSCYIVASLFLLATGVIGEEALLAPVVLGFGLIALVFSISRMKVFYFTPEILPLLGTEKTPILRPEWDSGAERLNTKLREIMQQIAPYKDENLTLNRLARMLSVEPRRLTYHFNVCLKQNFRHYLNGQRLEAVCRDLKYKPEQSILDTAFSNGFNSKSSFNTLFFKTYGMTPREFKKTNGNKSTLT